MKLFYKKSLKSVVAATLAMGGMAVFTSVNAATNANAVGDLAIIPYYTVKNNFITGVQVINVTNATQVVKIRLRRDNDSANVLDFNVIMSPYDHFSGFISKAGDTVVFNTTDNTCTAPLNNGTFTSSEPDISAGADEGYIEIIGMAQASDETQATAIAAKHNAAGVPLDCGFVEDNFSKTNWLTNALTRGPITSGVTNIATGPSAGRDSAWVDTPAEALKVSYFIRDAGSGMEMGDTATHIVNFAQDPMMTNQEDGLANGSVNGFDFPDLDGGGAAAGNRGLYDTVIRADLGTETIVNNWSFNPATNTATDWVITIPGQYLMINPEGDQNTAGNNGDDSIQTDIPVFAKVTLHDREGDEKTSYRVQVLGPGVIFSWLSHVSVIEWGGKTVFGSDNASSIYPRSSGLNPPFGWASLLLEPSTQSIGADTVAGLGDGLGLGSQIIYDLTDPTGDTAAAPVNPVPVVGFAAWQRKFGDNSNRNYGRIEAHSRK